MTVQVICLGEALVDRLGPLGGDTAANPDAVEDRLGGAPANVACALARLGTATAFVGRLGRDAIGTAFAELLTARGVDQSALQWDAVRPSRIVLVHRHHEGERAFGGCAGDAGLGFADQALDARALRATLAPLLAQARWLLLGTIVLASPASAEAAWLAVEQAEASGVAIAVDINWRPTFWGADNDPAAGPSARQRQQILDLLQRAQLIKCAAEEARWLFDNTDPASISRVLEHQPLVVVTDGGALLRWGSSREHGDALQPFVIKATDSTGAGDAFTAGLLHGLCSQAPAKAAEPTAIEPAALLELMRFASACGALVCQSPGAIDPQPSLAQVQDFLRNHQPGLSPEP